MDPRTSIAALALPKLAALVRFKFVEWLASPADVEAYEEEFFFDPKTNDVYCALSLQMRLQGKLIEKTFLARVPTEGPSDTITLQELLELELDDITHLAPEIAKVLPSSAAESTLKSALQTSMVLFEATS